MTMDLIKQLREKTGAGVMDAKKALEEVLSNSKLETRKSKQMLEEAAKIIQKRGLARAEEKADRETSQGLIYAYIHHDGKSGALIKLACETDFVARTDDFKNLAKELAMQVTSMDPKTVDEFVGQDYIRDSSMKIGDLIKQTAGKVGENIQLIEFKRLGL